MAPNKAPIRRTQPKAVTSARPAQAADDGGLQAGRLVGAVDGAVRILRYLSGAGQPVGVSRIAKDAGLNTSTAFNILRTLAAHDLVLFDPVSKSYALSLGLMVIARGATALGDDIDAARPEMERIALAHGVTVTLWQPVSRQRKMLVLSALTRNAMRIQMTVGQRLPIFTGATGRVFAAFGGYRDLEMKALFDQIRWDQPLDFAEFKAQALETRATGWAVDDGNFASGTISVAVPILDRDGRAPMAITATMFTGQYSQDKGADIVRDLTDLASRLGRRFAA